MPDIIVIGAMKCATSTLHEQLAQQPGVFMSTPKEPCFFSDDEVYERGLGWYAALFAAAPPDGLCGESSTHYTKLPTYPRTVARMRRDVPDARLIYVMRHPIDRLVSQYVHEWSERAVSGSIEQAVRDLPRLIDYSRYAMQLEPFLDTYGPERVLPVFFERLVRAPQAEFERICRFIGYDGTPRWSDDARRRNVSEQRLRRSALRDALVWNPAVTWVRRAVVPQRWRDRVKKLWQMNQRPQLTDQTRSRLEQVFDQDLARLGEWLGVSLSCATFKATVAAGPLEFAACASRRA